MAENKQSLEFKIKELQESLNDERTKNRELEIKIFELKADAENDYRAGFNDGFKHAIQDIKEILQIVR